MKPERTSPHFVDRRQATETAASEAPKVGSGPLPPPKRRVRRDQWPNWRIAPRSAVLHCPAMPEIRGSVLVFCIGSRTSITGSGCGRLNWLPMPADKRGRKSIGEGNVIEGSGDHVRPREVEILGEGMWRRHHEQPGTCCSSNPMRRVFDGN